MRRATFRAILFFLFFFFFLVEATRKINSVASVCRRARRVYVPVHSNLVHRCRRGNGGVKRVHISRDRAM